MSYFYQGLGHPIAHSQIVRDLNGTGNPGFQVSAPNRPTSKHLYGLYGEQMMPRSKPSQWASLGSYIKSGKHDPSHPN